MGFTMSDLDMAIKDGATEHRDTYKPVKKHGYQREEEKLSNELQQDEPLETTILYSKQTNRYLDKKKVTKPQLHASRQNK